LVAETHFHAFGSAAAASRSKKAGTVAARARCAVPDCKRKIFMSSSQATPDDAGIGSDRSKSASREEFEQQIAILKEEMELLKAQLARSSERSASAARRAAASGAENLREQGEAAIEDLRANARDVEAQLISTVREKPVTSLAIAAGVGFLFALITRR
jgi:ElaB/YqjD/DUF883 family membrane-anchored ribosome-binding protein